jgi:starch synthase
MPPIQVLFIASEAAPFVKTGGLADVIRALPRAIARAGCKVTVVIPRYRAIEPTRFGLARRLAPVTVELGGRRETIHVYEGKLPGGEVDLWLVDHPVFDRDGIYGEGGGDYPDSGFRYALLGRAALTLADHAQRWPDLLHVHDWHGGPALAHVAHGFGARPRPRTVLTIHNLSFLGLVPLTHGPTMGLTGEQIEAGTHAGQLSLLKLGLALADRITTVSPRYAAEIQTPEHGCGLDAFLRERSGKLVGILNGIDTQEWNPAHDLHLGDPFGPDHLAGKAACKTALQKEVGLPHRPNQPLVVSVSRATEQKGFPLILEAGEELARLDAQFLFLAKGERRFEEGLAALARRHPTKFAVKTAHDEALAHRIFAGGDLFLMPSRFEPCGLTQMIAQRYGTAPIVHAVGGLDDTVVDWDEKTRTGTGFKLGEPTAAAMLGTLKRALAAYRDRSGFQSLIGQMMQLEHGWSRRAQRYVVLYRDLIG